MILEPFSLEDIKDVKFLKKEIEEEALKIYNSSNNRIESLKDIKYRTMQGKVAEVYLMEKLGYKKADLEYHDLMNEKGEYIEVKAYSYGNIYNDFITRDLQKYKSVKWNKSKWYVLFNCVDGIYYHQATIKIRD